MSIRFYGGKRRIAAAILWAVVAFGAQLYAGMQEGAAMMASLRMAGLFGVFAFVATGIRIELKSWWSVILGLFFAAVSGWFLMHWVLIVGTEISWRAVTNNTLLSMVLLLIGLAVVGKPKAVAIGWLVLCYAFGMVETAVMQFRGSIIVLTDFLDVGTAMSVASGYSMYFMPRMISVTLALVLSVLLVARAQLTWKRSGKLWYRLLCVVLAAASAAHPVMQMDRLTAETWGRLGASKRGILMEFLLELGDLFVKPPEGYDPETAESIAQEYQSEDVTTDDRPHVIAIMGEAFSDLQAVGDFETSEPVLPFMHSLYEESAHGLALVSVFGGRTATSEWEFLTGNTAAFLPAGAMPYRQYAEEGMNSLVEVLENQGYHTIGMHCYRPGGWNRSQVYPDLGFDEVYFEDDFEWDEKIRTLVTDGAFFRKIVELYEQREEGKPLFLFGVTMQNHGGYTDALPVELTVNVEGMSQDYPDVNQYLSLLQLSDAALEEMITYFRNQDEKVVVVYFGDHMPQISGSFYNEAGIESGQKRYLVPWFIWKNYDTEEREIPLTSLNYLPSILLEEMGVEMPAYYDFLKEAREVVTAVNAKGCVADGQHLGLDALEGSALEMMEKYRILQYANMFDKAADEVYFSGSAE